VNAKRLIAAGALVVLAACGSSGSGVSSSAGTQLSARVDAVRAAAAHGDRRLAALRLAQLRTDLAKLQQTGQVSDGAAVRILRAAQSVHTQLVLLPEPTTTTTTTTTTMPAPDEHEKGKDHGPKHHDKPDEG
jgi:hypothetical protein